MCQGDGSLDTFLQTETSDLSIWRKPVQPASPRSKAVDSKAAHRFQTGRCNGCVFPVSDKPDRFCYYDDSPILPGKKKCIVKTRLVIYELCCCLACQGTESLNAGYYIFC